MGEKREKKANTPKSGGKRAGLRLLARKRREAMYAAHFGIAETNQRRNMQRHLRANPFDEQAAKRYEVDQGRVDTLGVNSKGKKLVRRRERAIRRLEAHAGVAVRSGAAGDLSVPV